MRVLLIGGGCRGLALARGLVAGGHTVRAVTRRAGDRRRIEAAGAECWLGDPGVVGTLRYALEHVTIVVWALATASGAPESIAALHGPRLRMLLGRTVDTTVRGIVYEAEGTVDPEVLAAGLTEVRRAHEVHGIPYAVVTADPADRPTWVATARRAIDGLIAVR